MSLSVNVQTNNNHEEMHHTTGSASAPATGDMAVVYATLVALAVVTFGFGVKKAYSK